VQRPAGRARLILGLCSGTSADGTDLALIRVCGAGPQRTAEFVAGAMAPFPDSLRTRILAAPGWSLEEFAAMHFRLGERFGQDARSFLERTGVAPAEVAVAGSHGQTVFHHDGDPRGGTLQCGDPSLVAARLGIPVVGDFRWGDLAAGGQGAPLSPFADWTLHRRAAARLAILNLGGIANLTLLEGEAPPRAWDAGPANGPLDALVRMETGQAFDSGGELSRRGRVLGPLLQRLQGDPFFQRPLPRSTGLERFGAPLARKLRSWAPQTPLADLLTTLIELCAWSVESSLEQAGWKGGTLVLCGGGAHHPGLRAALVRRLAPGIHLKPYSTLGWDPDLREAVAFALLADAALCGEPAAWPSSSGARYPALLGGWSLPPFLDPPRPVSMMLPTVAARLADC